MNLARNFTDKFAISISLACAIHCVVTPWLLVLLPSLSIFNLDNEQFHYWMVFSIVPLSLYALWSGCKQHKAYLAYVLGVVGLGVSVGVVVLGENVLGEFAEKAITLIGSALIVAGHYWNILLCKKYQSRFCGEN